jgi:thiol:disulfide interchange protein DsbD
MTIRYLIAALALFLPVSSQADENRVGLTVELVSEVTHIQPGTPFYVGVFISHEPGFHTYWKQPGIVGVPTSIKWDLPWGWKGGDLEYPEPESVLMFTIKAQGYERDVLLQAQITPPKKLKQGTSVTLAGKAVWMCCAKSCHPGFKDLTLTLPVATEAPPLDTKWHPVFEKERAAAPQESTAWSSSARLVSDTQFELLLTPATPEARPLSPALAKKVLYFTEDGWIDSDDPHSITFDPSTNGLRLLLPLSKGFRDKRPPKTLASLLQLSGGWQKSGRPHTLRLASPLGP